VCGELQSVCQVLVNKKKGVGVKPTPTQEYHMLTWLTPELDQDIREYALYLSPDDGEDGYHNAIETYLRLKVSVIPTNPHGYLRVLTKRAVFKIWRDRTSNYEQEQKYAQGHAPDCTPALVKGRQPKTHCRRGHEFTVDNIIYVGKARTCKTCEQLRRKTYKEKQP